MNVKYKKVCTALNYFKCYIVSISVVSGFVSVSVFTSALVVVSVSITHSAVRTKICKIIAEIKSSESIIQKKRKKYRYLGENVRIRSYSGLHCPVSGLNTDKYFTYLHIQSECGKMQTRITPNAGTFYIVRKI